MKKIFLFIFPLSLYAVDIHPQDVCETLKSSLMQGVESAYNHSSGIDYNLSLLSQDIQFNRESNTGLENYVNQSSTMNATDKSSVSSIARSNLVTLNRMEQELASVSNQNVHIRYELDNISNVVSSIECVSCSVGSGSNCCDFTSIEQRLDVQIGILDNIDIMIDYMVGVQDQIYQSLVDLSLVVSSGFGNVTNALDTFLIFSTNSFINSYLDTSKLPASLFPSPSSLHPGMYYRSRSKSQGWTTISPYGNSNYQPSSPLTLTRAAYAIQNTIPQSLVSLNNATYWRTKEFDEPLLFSTTNYFSFFRGEIGVKGVLSDWQSEQVSGSYHDFLTNHYLTVVRGGSLSGNQSTKTNWFSRIETLLAALVFTDSSETNTVDSSVGEDERSQVQSSYLSVNGAASSFSGDLQNASDSIIQLYQNYFSIFENAAMPSQVVLMRLNGQGDSEETEIAFSSDSLSVLVEGCRLVTTLCWSSAGIFLLYKFLVWSARCVTVACQFIYRVISSVFKS